MFVRCNGSKLRSCLFELLVNFEWLAFGTSKNRMSSKTKSQKHVATCFSASGF
uniref:Uncharacterized protein n=1 Tax=Arundo donax TaxID=35708 RepID=A0A0A9CWW6_ARUDO